MQYRKAIRFTLLFVSVALVVWALARILQSSNEPARVTFEVTNTGLPLAREEYVVQILSPDGGQLVATSETHGDALIVPPGRYDVKAIIIGSHPEQSFVYANQLARGGRITNLTFDFAYGELHVQHANQQALGPEERLIVEVFAVSEHQKRIVAFEAGKYMKLAPGTYDVRVVLSHESRERHVRWHKEIVIEPGRQRSLLNNFERGFVVVPATDNGEAISPDEVRLSVYAPGDALREVLQSGVAGLPLSLASGSYDIEVKYLTTADATHRLVESIVVRDQETTTRPVEFATSSFATQANLGDAAIFKGFAVYTYVYAPNDHRNAIAYAPQQQTLKLSPGTYDLRVELVNAPAVPNIWSYRQQLVAGAEYTHQVSFDAGYLLVHAISKSGKELIGQEAKVSIFPRGSRELPILKTISGVATPLPAGEFDVVVEETYKGTKQSVQVTINAGATADPKVLFENIE